MGNEQEQEHLNAEATYPSVDLAYPLATASYDSIIKRLDSLDAKVQSLMTFSLGAFLAIPVITKAQGVSINSLWFGIGVLCLLIAVIISTYARFCGEIKVINPMVLYKETLHFQPYNFKVTAIYGAAKAYEYNVSLLKRRWDFVILATLLYASALLSLSVWVAFA